MSVEKEVTMCSCCGEMRPFPRKPGWWQYLVYPATFKSTTVEETKIINGQKTVISTSTSTDEPYYPWQTVRVVSHEEGNQIIPFGAKDPIWWPREAKWRKVCPVCAIELQRAENKLSFHAICPTCNTDLMEIVANELIWRGEEINE